LYNSTAIESKVEHSYGSKDDHNHYWLVNAYEVEELCYNYCKITC